MTGHPVAGGRSAGLVVALTVLVVGGCEEAPSAPDVVARIGAEELRYAEFQSYLDANVPRSLEPLSHEVMSALFDQFLEELLLTRLAVDTGRANAESSRRQVLESVARELAAQQIPHEQVRAYYEDRRDELSLPERVSVRQLLLADRPTAESVREALLSGLPFDALVDHLTGSAQLLGSEEGELTRDDLPRQIADVVFDLEEGEISSVIAADYGFHVFQMGDRLPAGVPPFEDLAPSLRQDLQRQEVDRGLERLVMEARDRYNVRVFARNLPFIYSGSFTRGDAK
jgi:hypothetical protein